MRRTFFFSNTQACSFAHGEADLRVSMQRYRRVQEVHAGRLDHLTFKTRPCTKVKIGVQASAWVRVQRRRAKTRR